MHFSSIAFQLCDPGQISYSFCLFSLDNHSAHFLRGTDIKIKEDNTLPVKYLAWYLAHEKYIIIIVLIILNGDIWIILVVLCLKENF